MHVYLVEFESGDQPRGFNPAFAIVAARDAAQAGNTGRHAYSYPIPAVAQITCIGARTDVQIVVDPMEPFVIKLAWC